ncbi:hypothetical protein LCGC14_2133980 [marine sediment metagenome]|uniref:Uncharacterized protein n=1 Tax=marine sediment metagenome TaxID=412755 RepID=A0A0F9E0M0_9ZZZZ
MPGHDAPAADVTATYMGMQRPGLWQGSKGGMMTSKDCKYYLKGGKCSHKYAPHPNHSWCIGDEEIGGKCEEYKRKEE